MSDLPDKSHPFAERTSPVPSSPASLPPAAEPSGSLALALMLTEMKAEVRRVTDQLLETNERMRRLERWREDQRAVDARQTQSITSATVREESMMASFHLLAERLEQLAEATQKQTATASETLAVTKSQTPTLMQIQRRVPVWVAVAGAAGAAIAAFVSGFMQWFHR